MLTNLVNKLGAPGPSSQSASRSGGFLCVMVGKSEGSKVLIVIEMIRTTDSRFRGTPTIQCGEWRNFDFFSRSTWPCSSHFLQILLCKVTVMCRNILRDRFFRQVEPWVFVSLARSASVQRQVDAGFGNNFSIRTEFPYQAERTIESPLASTHRVPCTNTHCH